MTVREYAQRMLFVASLGDEVTTREACTIETTLFYGAAIYEVELTITKVSFPNATQCLETKQ